MRQASLCKWILSILHPRCTSFLKRRDLSCEPNRRALVTPTRSRKRSWGAMGACRTASIAGEQTAPQGALGAGAPRSLPAHGPRSPASLLRGPARQGTPVYPPGHRPQLEPARSAEPLPPPRRGRSRPPETRGYLHTGGSHAAPGLRRSPASLPAAAQLRTPAPVLGPLRGAGPGGRGAGRRAESEAAFKAQRLTPGRAGPPRRRPAQLGLR